MSEFIRGLKDGATNVIKSRVTVMFLAGLAAFAGLAYTLEGLR